MLLLIARKSMWMELPNQACYACADTQQLSSCSSCRKILCPACSITYTDGDKLCLECSSGEPAATKKWRTDKLSRQARNSLLLLGVLISFGVWAALGLLAAWLLQ